MPQHVSTERRLCHAEQQCGSHACSMSQQVAASLCSCAATFATSLCLGCQASYRLHPLVTAECAATARIVLMSLKYGTANAAACIDEQAEQGLRSDCVRRSAAARRSNDTRTQERQITCKRRVGQSSPGPHRQQQRHVHALACAFHPPGQTAVETGCRIVGWQATPLLCKGLVDRGATRKTLMPRQLSTQSASESAHSWHGLNPLKPCSRCGQPS